MSTARILEYLLNGKTVESVSNSDKKDEHDNQQNKLEAEPRSDLSFKAHEPLNDAHTSEKKQKIERRLDFDRVD